MIINPRHLKPGDRVSIYGFRDAAMGERQGETIRRRGRFTKMIRCRAEVYEIRFDKGYTEHWSYIALLYALNGHMPPTTYNPRNMTPEEHLLELMRGRKHHA